MSILNAKIERPSPFKYPAATSIKLPTLRLAPPIKRSSSYSMPCTTNESVQAQLDKISSSTDTQLPDYHQQVKATLTNILNDDRVKHDPNGSRCVQAILLENEHDMRKQRRESLGARPTKHTLLL